MAPLSLTHSNLVILFYKCWCFSQLNNLLWTENKVASEVDNQLFLKVKKLFCTLLMKSAIQFPYLEVGGTIILKMKRLWLIHRAEVKWMKTLPTYEHERRNWIMNHGLNLPQSFWKILFCANEHHWLVCESYFHIDVFI